MIYQAGRKSSIPLLPHFHNHCRNVLACVLFSLQVVANVLLGDSSGSTRYRYHITIQTGMWRGFGTTSRVGMIVAGKNGSSGVLALNDLAIASRLFSRASVNNFTLSVPKCLGSLSGVYVWHDNSGPRPAWFLQHIEITDEQTDEKWYFFANRWLALDKGAGVTQLYLKVKQISNFP